MRLIKHLKLITCSSVVNCSEMASNFIMIKRNIYMHSTKDLFFFIRLLVAETLLMHTLLHFF